jgi:hypothetical protein
MVRRMVTVAFACAAAAACGDGPSGPDDNCSIVALPLQGSANAPTVTDVALEVQPGGIVVLATATDPQGSADLANVVQSIGVFPNDDCTGIGVVLLDDISASGVEESFGTVFTSGQNPLQYGNVSAAASWPVMVDFRDVDGNRTSGQVRARIIH